MEYAKSVSKGEKEKEKDDSMLGKVAKGVKNVGKVVDTIAKVAIAGHTLFTIAKPVVMALSTLCLETIETSPVLYALTSNIANGVTQDFRAQTQRSESFSVWLQNYSQTTPQYYFKSSVSHLQKYTATQYSGTFSSIARIGVNMFDLLHQLQERVNTMLALAESVKFQHDVDLTSIIENEDEWMEIRSEGSQFVKNRLDALNAKLLLVNAMLSKTELNDREKSQIKKIKMGIESKLGQMTTMTQDNERFNVLRSFVLNRRLRALELRRARQARFSKKKNEKESKQEVSEEDTEEEEET